MRVRWINLSGERITSAILAKPESQSPKLLLHLISTQTSKSGDVANNPVQDYFTKSYQPLMGPKLEVFTFSLNRRRNNYFSLMHIMNG